MSDFHDLPPFVKGKIRSHLNFSIENINWKTSKTFSDVRIRVVWWGQREGTFCEGIRINKQPPLSTVCYAVKTGSKLLASYLSNCDPVKLEIFSSKTKDFIGSAEFPINHQELSQKICRLKSKILTSRQFCLGELSVCIEITSLKTMTRELKLFKSVAEPQSNLTSFKRKTLIVSKPVTQKLLKEKNSNKENIQVIGNKKKISFRDLTPSKLQKTPQKKTSLPSNLHTSASKRIASPPNEKKSLKLSPLKLSHGYEKSSLVNYLSGEAMSHLSQSVILQNLVAISPTQSVVKSLSNIEVAPKKLQTIADKIDSIRITVLQTELNQAGLLETQNFLKHHQKCVLKCAVTSKIFRPNEDLRMISPVFETATKKISFNKELKPYIVLPKRSRSGIFINFGLCLKSIEQQTPPFFVGFARIALSEISTTKLTCHKMCPIMNESGMSIGTMSVKLELGSRGLHFGQTLIDLFHTRQENVSICSGDLLSVDKSIKLLDQKVQTRSHPSHSNDDRESDRNYENKHVQTDKSSTSKNTNSDASIEYKDTELVDVDNKKNSAKSKVYRGLLFIEELRNIKDHSQTEYFITFEGFWNECHESTETCVNCVFNYLKLFPVICNESFLKRVQNSHLELKLWEKTRHSEKWIGSTRIPLHQFFIAFRDVSMIEHLSLNQLPIISIDTWSNFISPLSSEFFCQGKILLAIGSENQIEYLKLLRNLNNLRLPPARYATGVQVATDPSIQIKHKLTEFIESLSQKLPEPSSANSSLQKLSSDASSTTSGQSKLKKTSELLESLQKALALPSQPASLPTSSTSNHEVIASDSSMSSMSLETVQIMISIEHANYLPKIIKKKQNRRKNRTTTTSQETEFEPTVYVTFESCLDQLDQSSLPNGIVKSHEGFVHCTKTLKGCDPEWNERFDVKVPLDILLNSQKRFIVKVWRKILQDSEMRATPFQDAIIGFSAIDLSVLLTGLPILSGYYNIMDFSGRCNGQIKLSFKPSENLLFYQNSSSSIPEVNNVLKVDLSPPNDGANLLSRTLKRKFTELDEITERLKARLFDVTGDENFDPDDEFERDLNTVVDEVEEEKSDMQDFAWLKTSSNEFQSKLYENLDSQPSTSKQSVLRSPSTYPILRQVSGCSNSQPIAMDIDQLLKKYDLDTLINPIIFKNILDPTLANSDSTPTLNPKPLNNDGNVSTNSGDTTVSSVLSIDQVQTIQNALQKASLESDQSSSRKDPDGGGSE